MTANKFNDCLDRMKDGDTSGFEAIFKAYYGKLVAYADSFFTRNGIAEEIVSSVFLRILKDARNYGYIDYPAAWLFAAVKNAVIDHIRKVGKERLTDFSRNEPAGRKNDVVFKVALCQKLSEFTERQRDIVRLRFVSGLNIRETAEAAEVSASTVKRDLKIVREELKKFMKDF